VKGCRDTRIVGSPCHHVTVSPCYGVTVSRESPLSSSTSLVTLGSQDGSVEDRFILLFQEEHEVCATGDRGVER